MSVLGEMMAKQRNDVSVKIDAKVYRLVKAVASYKGLSVAEYLSEIVKPLASRDWAKINREVSKGREEADETDEST